MFTLGNLHFNTYTQTVNGVTEHVTDNPLYDGPPDPPAQHLKPGRNATTPQRPPPPSYPPPRRPPAQSTTQFQMPSGVDAGQRAMAATLAREAAAARGNAV